MWQMVVGNNDIQLTTHQTLHQLCRAAIKDFLQLSMIVVHIPVATVKHYKLR